MSWTISYVQRIYIFIYMLLRLFSIAWPIHCVFLAWCGILVALWHIALFAFCVSGFKICLTSVFIKTCVSISAGFGCVLWSGRFYNGADKHILYHLCVGYSKLRPYAQSNGIINKLNVLSYSSKILNVAGYFNTIFTWKLTKDIVLL
jgi:hypothetical protein